MKRPTGSVPRRCEQHEDVDFLRTFDILAIFLVPPGFTLEQLRRQGLLEGTWCLDPDEAMGPGQEARLDRLLSEHPELTDDAFVAANLDRWLG